jgi:hypothetical protein
MSRRIEQGWLVNMLLMMNEELDPLRHFVNAVHLSGLRVNILATRAALARPKVGVLTPPNDPVCTNPHSTYEYIINQMNENEFEWAIYAFLHLCLQLSHYESSSPSLEVTNFYIENSDDRSKGRMCGTIMTSKIRISTRTRTKRLDTDTDTVTKDTGPGQIPSPQFSILAHGHTATS